MRKLFYPIALCTLAAAAMGSCDRMPENPGNFNVVSEVMVGSIISASGDEYPVKFVREIDTIYQHRYFKYDTLKNAQGEPVVVNGRMTITTDTLYYPSTYTARYKCSDTIMLPAKADTFSVKVKSNARWFAPVPDNKKLKQWLFNYNASLSGSGDGTLQFYVERNRAKRRANYADQVVFTQDTTVMLNIVIGQRGERD